jgi:hypothetical protein
MSKVCILRDTPHASTLRTVPQPNRTLTQGELLPAPTGFRLGLAIAGLRPSAVAGSRVSAAAAAGRHRRADRSDAADRTDTARNAVAALAAVAGTAAVIALILGLVTVWQLYSASDTELVLGSQVAGLERAPDIASPNVAGERLTAVTGIRSPRAAVYRDPSGRQPSVTVAVGSELSWQPGVLMNKAMAGYDQPVDFYTGTLGGFMRCSFARDNHLVGTYCAWVDRGSVGIGLFPGRGVPDAGELFGRIRAQVTTR